MSDKVMIQLTNARDGVGAAGEVVVVGAERAERWCKEGLAVMPEKKKKPSAAVAKLVKSLAGARTQLDELAAKRDEASAAVEAAEAKDKQKLQEVLAKFDAKHAEATKLVEECEDALQEAE